MAHWATELGLSALGVSQTALPEAEQQHNAWLARSFHGDMDYMAHHGIKRTRPTELEPGTVSIIAVRMDYLPEPQEVMESVLHTSDTAYVSRYALGRDYHKVLRQRLKQLVKKMENVIGPFAHRIFVDSAPVLEKPIAALAGLGWVGKHSNVLTREGSWFFLGEIYCELPLEADAPIEDHCGTCRQCMEVCPTEAIVEPYVVDARRCISYLTIELHDAIPVTFRKAMGNRIYGCDDCQLYCPWNRFTSLTNEPDFAPRHGLDSAKLTELFRWDEATFLSRTEGTALRRIGHERWLRNIAVALGNASDAAAAVAALQSRNGHCSELVQEHIDWALRQHSIE